MFELFLGTLGKKILSEIKLTATDTLTVGGFGFSLGISNDGKTAIVNAPNTTGATDRTYVFVKNGLEWVQSSRLQPSEPPTIYTDGHYVAISGDGNTAAIGQIHSAAKGNQSGSVFIFVKNESGWAQQTRLNAVDAQAGEYFGSSLAFSADGNTLAIGAFYGDVAGLSNCGSAYIFTRTTGVWSQQAKLIASDRAANDQLGYRIALSSDGNLCIVGAQNHTTKNSYDGSAYIFTRTNNSWTQSSIITPNDVLAGDRFGGSVAISQDMQTIVVGSPLADDKGSNSGSVRVFTNLNGVWSQVARLSASNGGAEHRFGVDVAISGDGQRIAVGATGGPGVSLNSGSVYLFSKTNQGWTESQTLVASDGSNNGYYGYDLCMSPDGKTLLVGSHNRNAVYAYNL